MSYEIQMDGITLESVLIQNSGSHNTMRAYPNGHVNTDHGNWLGSNNVRLYPRPANWRLSSNVKKEAVDSTIIQA